MRRKNSGQMVVILALAIPPLLGAIALGTDVTVFYFNWVQLYEADSRPVGSPGGQDI